LPTTPTYTAAYWAISRDKEIRRSDAGGNSSDCSGAA
jgi:hypothetical protein